MGPDGGGGGGVGVGGGGGSGSGSGGGWRAYEGGWPTTGGNHAASGQVHYHHHQGGVGHADRCEMKGSLSQHQLQQHQLDRGGGSSAAAAALFGPVQQTSSLGRFTAKPGVPGVPTVPGVPVVPAAAAAAAAAAVATVQQQELFFRPNPAARPAAAAATAGAAAEGSAGVAGAAAAAATPIVSFERVPDNRTLAVAGGGGGIGGAAAATEPIDDEPASTVDLAAGGVDEVASRRCDSGGGDGNGAGGGTGAVVSVDFGGIPHAVHDLDRNPKNQQNQHQQQPKQQKPQQQEPFQLMSALAPPPLLPPPRVPSPKGGVAPQGSEHGRSGWPPAAAAGGNRVPRTPGGGGGGVSARSTSALDKLAHEQDHGQAVRTWVDGWGGEIAPHSAPAMSGSPPWFRRCFFYCRKRKGVLAWSHIKACRFRNTGMPGFWKHNCICRTSIFGNRTNVSYRFGRIMTNLTTFV